MADKSKDPKDVLDDLIAKAAGAESQVPKVPSEAIAHGEVETREELNAQLKAYQEAIASEYVIAQASESEQTRVKLSDYFRANANTAAEQIVYLSTNAESESVAASCSKYIIDHAFAGSEESDGITELMRQLSLSPNETANGEPVNKNDGSAQ